MAPWGSGKQAQQRSRDWGAHNSGLAAALPLSIDQSRAPLAHGAPGAAIAAASGPDHPCRC